MEYFAREVMLERIVTPAWGFGLMGPEASGLPPPPAGARAGPGPRRLPIDIILRIRPRERPNEH